MNCPDTSVLQHFTDDPEQLGESLFEIEAHISNCHACQLHLELATRICELPNLLGIDQATAEFDSDLEQPPDIPGYAIERLAGRGGFGAVYRARQTSTGRHVAIKVARNLSRNQLKRNQREANVAAQLDHPNLVRLYDYGTNDLYSYYIFEWVDENLSERLAVSLISLTQVVEWMVQLSQGVSFLHGLKIIHRDLKPSNILVTAQDQVKLTDFGIVKDLSDPANTASNARAIGTPGFMSPEQVGLNGVPVGPYTDVYGLGAVLYAMLVGHAPFVGGDSQAVLRQVVHQQPYAPSKVRNDLPRDLEVICLKCLEKDHHDRYASVDELSQDLQRFAAGSPISARPISRPARIWRACKRQPLVAALSAALSILLLLGLLLFVLAARRERVQQADLLAQSFCKIILSASPDKLSVLYDHVGDHSSEAIQRNINLLSSDPQLSPTGMIRLLCLLPERDLPVLSPEQLTEAMQGLSAIETFVTVNRVKHCSTINSSASIDRLRSLVKAARPDSSKLPIISLLAAIDSQWSDWEINSDQVLKSLALCPAEDAPLWAKLLKPVKDQLINTIVGQALPVVPAEAELLVPKTTGSDVKVASPLDSAAVFSAIWQWAQEDSECIVPLIKAMPLSRLAILRTLHSDQRQSTIASLRKEIQTLRAAECDWQSHATNPELAESLSLAGGAMNGRGGYVTAMLRSEAPKFIAFLCQQRMALSSIQPYHQNGQDFFSATFERLNRAAEVDSVSTDDAGEISWSVELKDVDEEVKRRAQRGLNVEAIWAFPEAPVQRLAILWRKDASANCRIVWDVEGVDAFAGRLGDLDSNDLETELVQQSFVLDGKPPREWEIGLLKQRAIPRRDERTRRFVQIVKRTIGFQPSTAPSRWVEHISGGASYLSIAAELSAHATQSQALLDNGYQPVTICIAPHTGQALSQWCLKQSPQRQRLRDEIASLVIAAWLLGDIDPVLDAIEFSRDPTLRTTVVETLGNVDQHPTSYQLASHRQLTVAQLQGLLLALGNWPASQLVLFKDELYPWLQSLWNHDDSGLHYAADQLLRRMEMPDYQQILRGDLVESHGLSNRPEARNWYYGPLGLPFVIVNPVDMDVLGTDERIPWVSTIDRRMGTLRRKLAVCAIETPDWLMRQHIDESAEKHAGLNLPQNTVTHGPAAGYRLESVLHFCNWMSAMDGISTETIYIPPRIQKKSTDEDKDSPRLYPECFLEADGYRLPTNLEWEMFARAGTWTSNHLGDRFDYLSNYGWNSANCESHPRAIGLLKPNPLGLFDVLGNVYEFALGGNSVTGFRDNPESFDEKTHDPAAAVNIRGGSFLSSRIYCSSGAGHHILIKNGDINAGFRIVRTLTENQ